MVELRILGTPDLRRTGDDGTCNPLHLQPKRLALLAYLALATPSRRCRRDTLLAMFWPELDEAHARNALSQGVHRLRRTLGKGVVLSQGAEDLRVAPERFWCDASAFEQALRRHQLTDALDLYRGPLLDGLHVEEAPGFEHWLATERDRLRRRASGAAATLAGQHEAAGNLAGAAHWLRRCLTLAPEDESVVQRLMDALHRLGDRAGALRAYEAFARRLAEELDLSPATATQQLADRLRSPAAAVPTPKAGDLPSVAVLPLANMSADPEQVYFCDGMTEEIINALTQISGLRVAARTSVFARKDQPIDLRALAQTLGVDAFIEGSVRRAGDQLRVTVQLVDAADGYHLWSARYDRPLQDVFAIQDEIARSIADTLRAGLLQAPDVRPASSPTEDMEAHALYLKGLFHRRKRTPADLEKACTAFQQAVARDPNYAQAHAALALTYALSGWFLYDVFAPRRAYPLAGDAAEKALSLNDRLAEAHLAIALVRKAFAWDWPGAEAAFEKALALDPDNLDTIGNYASYLVSRGRFEEALALTERGEVLDPFWIMPRVGVGIWLLAARRYDDAIERLLQAQEMEPRFFVAPLFLGDAYCFNGCLGEARAAYQRVLDLIGHRPIILGRLGTLYAAQERSDAALEMIEALHALAEKRHVLPSLVAGIYLALGDHDRAFCWLEKAYEARDTTLVLLASWPAYDPIRSDPRFQVLLEKVGLAE